MRTWKRFYAAVRCGNCGHAIPSGAPVLEWLVVTRRYRCEACARSNGFTPPGDLPALAPKVEITPTPLQRVGTLGLPFDHKLAAAGREPGEDDA